MSGAAVDYPTTLPNAQLGTFKAAPEPRTLRTSVLGGPSRFRKINPDGPIIVNVQWIFNQFDFENFSFWFENDVDQGENQFNINLRGSNGFESFCANFLGMFRYSLISNSYFRVDAQLELLQNAVPAPPPTLNIVVFSALGGATYNPPSLVSGLRFIVTGGGGGGGGVDGISGSNSAVAVSGSAAGTGISFTNTIESSYTFFIGAGGAGGSGSGAPSGSNGTASTITSTNVNITASGGTGGNGQLAAGTNDTLAGSIGATSTGGDVNTAGGASTPSSRQSGFPTGYSYAGASYFSGVGKSNNNTTGGDGDGFGSGGGGAAVQGITNNFSGGSGADGVIIVEEYSD